MTRRFRGSVEVMRIDRLAAGVTAARLAEVAQIDPSRLSRAERGLVQLTVEEEARRKNALLFCTTEPVGPRPTRRRAARGESRAEAAS